MGGANVWAESKTYNYTFRSGDFSTSKHSATLNGVTWTLSTKNWTRDETYDFDKSKGFKIGSNKQYPENVTLSTSEIGSTITSIVVNTSGNKDTKAKLDVFVGGKAFGKRQSLTNVATGLSFKGSASGEIELKYSYNEKNAIYIKSIAVTYGTAPAKNLTSLAISGQPTKTTYNVGEEFDPTGLEVTGTYDDKSTATITDGITWTKNPKTMSLGNTSCTVKASVGEVNSEPFEVNGLKVVRTISLSIDPTTSTVVKAPVKVTLNATEGATVYYTTNGYEPTTSSDIYNGPFEVTKSETTVKALAVADGADDVKAEATYTIKPEQPVFSAESKTFKDAFDVTLSLPGSTNATSKIYYKINGTATAESTPYNGPINISAENDGDKVILHAVVVDEYGNVGQEKYCTYTKSSALVFDFAANPNAWGITPLNKNGKTESNVIAGKTLEVDGVVMTATNGSGQGTCIYKTSAGDVSLKVYKDATITFTAPVGYNISEILFDGKNLGNLSSEEETYTAPSWTGNAPSVQFSNSSKAVDIYTASIKLVAAAAEPTYTAQTLKFIAKTSEGYYATFSSDKVTFVTSNHVIPNVVTVTNGKIDMNSKMFKPEKTTIESAEVDGYYIPANTGILLYSDAVNVDYYTVENKTVDALAEGTNMLMPAPANGGAFNAEAGYEYFKLAYDDLATEKDLGFYWGAPKGGAFYVKAGTAYLAVHETNVAGAKGFTLSGEATGIEGVNANVENAKAIYNLNGQRVASMAKPGLYIVNGKKMVVRK